MVYDANRHRPDLLGSDHTRYPGLQQRQATAVMNVPVQFENSEACFMQGQAYIATTSIGQGLGDNDLVKIVCTRSETTSVTRLRIK
jgi:hypothetical protein